LRNYGGNNGDGDSSYGNTAYNLQIHRGNIDITSGSPSHKMNANIVRPSIYGAKTVYLHAEQITARLALGECVIWTLTSQKRLLENIDFVNI